MTDEVTCPDCHGNRERMVSMAPGITVCTTCPDCKGTGLRVVEPALPAPPKRTRREILLSQCMKPEDIDGSTDKRHARVRELVSWFARFAEGHANPKWAREHAFELAVFAHDMMATIDALAADRRR